MTYYVDVLSGRDEHDGLTPEKAVKNVDTLPVCPGDRVLFSRNRTYHGGLFAISGTKDAPVYYGTYGRGEKPRFSGTQELSCSWIEVGKKIWKYTGALLGEPGNVIFDGGVTCGKLCFEMEGLSHAGDWFYTKLGGGNETNDLTEAAFYLYSDEAPQKIYKMIECAVKLGWRLCSECNNVILENISFYGSAVHAFQTSNARNITIRNCDFSFIGGAVWSLERQIRFGNAIEFWDCTEDIWVENCLFDNIYDSCVTTQGPTSDFTVRNVNITNNYFYNYGMAAFEIRDVMPVNSCFANNICNIGNGGFSGLFDGDTRQSEIHPEPMGHHLFLWRIDIPSPNGSVRIMKNHFSATPKGAAIYARIADAATAQINSDENSFDAEKSLRLCRFGDQSYKTAEDYQEGTGFDRCSTFSS